MRMNNPKANDEWYTPADETAVFRRALGITEFDCDPCSPMSGPTVPARVHYTQADDGLVQPWPAGGVIWMNPPYSSKQDWLVKAALGVCNGEFRAVLGLLPGNTSTPWYHDFVLPWPHWLRRGRIKFVPGHRTEFDGRMALGSVLILFSLDAALIERFRLGLQGSRWEFTGYRVPEPQEVHHHRPALRLVG
ncbi:MAG TPA: DNA N-6-adenine-methyltransferase [Azospirillum sp.]|nr:DNA N-6-adenine-methyltransferase [Azospirillum sp.]